MNIKIDLNGRERKELVNAISEITEQNAEYLKTPTYAYRIGDIIVTKEAYIEADDETQLEFLLEQLSEKGFVAVVDTETSGLTVTLPRSLFTDVAIENLKHLIEAKGALIKKALGVEALPVEITEERIEFPWFESVPTAEETQAYARFISALAQLAGTQKRVSCREKEVANEKYAFRCFLLRLGFIGSEYKNERKILLTKLEGNSAFKSVKEAEKNEVSEVR